MRLQILAAIVVPFVFGAAIGFSTRIRTSASAPVESKPSGFDSTSTPVRHPEMTPAVAKTAPAVLPKIIAGRIETLSPRQQALRLAFNLISPVLLQKHLFLVTWGNPRMERKAFDLLRALSNPEDLDLFVQLQLLDGMSDPEVRAEFAAWTRTEPDPRQKSRLAAIAGRQWTYGELLPLIEELMADASDPVVASVLERLSLTRKELEADPQFLGRVTRLMVAAAGSNRSEAVRVDALQGLRRTGAGPSRFLIDVIVSDRNDRVVCAAISALPPVYRLDDEPGLAVEMIRLLYSIATDESRPSQVRFSAALAADHNDSSIDEEKVLNPEEQALVQKILFDLGDK